MVRVRDGRGGEVRGGENERGRWRWRGEGGGREGGGENEKGRWRWRGEGGGEREVEMEGRGRWEELAQKHIGMKSEQNMYKYSNK